MILKPPFPYFGGKRWLAPQVWRWLGADVKRYIEPFAGGLGVLLARPGGPRPRWQEVINDEYAHIANVWRAVKYHGEEVWANCQDPLHEADLHGRTQRLIAVEASYRDAMFADPTWCDPQLAGWWIWAQSAHLAQSGTRRGDKSKPCATPGGVLSIDFAKETLDKISARMQSVQILCGDFGRCLTPSYLLAEKQTVGVYLDPPYALGDDSVYGTIDNVSVWSRTVEWVLANVNNPRLRIVLSGYRGSPGDEELTAAGMVRHDFAAPGGHGSKGQDNKNNELEACWISKACIVVASQLGLFDLEGDC